MNSASRLHRALSAGARLQASAFSAYEGSFVTFASLIDNLGFKGVELRNFIGTRTEILPHRVPEVKRILDQHQFRATLHLPAHLNLVDPSATARAHCFEVYRTGIQVAGEVGADVVVIHGGKHPDPEVGYALSVEALVSLAEEARACNVVLALENSERAPENLFQHPSEFERIKACEDIAVVMDIGHLATLGLTLVQALEFDVIRSRLVEVHLHDNDGQADRHWGLGEGSIDIDEALSTLAALGFEGVYTVEAKSVPGLVQSATYLGLR